MDSIVPGSPLRPLTVSDSPERILYCRCAFAQAVPAAVKDGVLDRLCNSGAAFESVADLCEMAARKDERLKDLVGSGENVRVVACFPRAVRWLLHHAGTPLPDDGRVEILNMREKTVDEICEALHLEP